MSERKVHFTEFDSDTLFASSSEINNHFQKIWSAINQTIDLNMPVEKAISMMKDLIVYDILDGNRTTLISKSFVGYKSESAFYVLHFIHTLRTLGAKKCYIMIHTSYNRERGKSELNYILEKISIGAPLIKKYALEHNIRCICIGMKKDYEHIDFLNDLMESTKYGDFYVYFLFDYNELWFSRKEAQNIFDILPNIDVHIRHTKFQPSGGWIPDKMSRSVFLYSQNGTLYSNWESDELVTLVALSLLTKLLHAGELLKKRYKTKGEINQRFELRELELTNRVIYLREKPKKLFMLGSPTGIYQFYY